MYALFIHAKQYIAQISVFIMSLLQLLWAHQKPSKNFKRVL